MPPLPPLPLTRLTPDHFAGVTQVHASDPARPGFHVWVPVPALGRTGDVLDVTIDSAREDEQIAALRALVAAVVADRHRRPPDPP